eukprot:COSAG05_NODE_3216_length_2234_cov_78.090870_4_plen_71_part_00
MLICLSRWGNSVLFSACLFAQGGDADSLKCWRMLLTQSEVAFNEIYDKLDVKGLTLRGESFYNPMLQVQA